MTQLILKYNQNTGEITGREYQPDDYTPGSGEYAIENAENADIRNLEGRKLDLSKEPPILVPNPGYPPVRRSKVSEGSKRAFRDARSNNDLQTQLDILFEVLTGEKP